MNTSTWCFLNEGQRSALLARKDCKAEVLPKHMNAAGSIKSVWTLIFKCTLKLSHLIAAVSQAAFCVIRSMHCWLKIWQPKVLWLVDLTSMAAGYLAQNPIWKKGSLTNYHYFKKKTESGKVCIYLWWNEERKTNPEPQLCLISKSVPIKAPLFAHLSLDLLVCWKQFYPEQELIFI